jgi:hypothetical protein
MFSRQPVPKSAANSGSSVISHQSSVTIYPNPTSRISNFKFQVSSFQHITVKIYDLHGREVATVIDQQLPAGEHVVRFDASHLPSGVYIYRTLVESTCHPDPPTGGEGPAVGKLIIIE